MAPATPADEPRLDLLVAGHVNIDRFLRVERMPASDRTVPLVAERAVLGGTAATFARVAARAGVRTGLISRVGLDFSEAFLAELRRDGVDLRGLERVPDTRSPSCYIVEDGQGHQFTLIHQGPMGDTRGAEIPEPLFREARWLHLTTGAPSYQLALKERARALGLRVSVDPSQELHYLWKPRALEALLAGTEILFGNEREIAQVLRLLHRKDWADLLSECALIVRTEGPRGVTALSRAGRLHVAAPKIRGTHQVTGAGDAFRGGFYGAFFQGLPLEAALRAGVRSAAGWMKKGPASVGIA